MIKMAVWVTGDIHGDPRRFSSDIFPEQKEMTKDDIVIILGDFGLVWDYKGESKTEKYWLDWLDKKPFTTIIIDGNHDNFDRLDDYTVEEWHCGASSHDISAGILDPDEPEFQEKKKRLDKNPYSQSVYFLA